MSARSPICLPGASEWASRYKIQIQMQSRNHCRQSDEWTSTTSSLWSFVWRVTSSAELTASSIHHSLSHSPCLWLLLSRLHLTLILIYALYICSRMWIRCGEAAGHLAAGQNGLKQLPHIVKLPALSAATWLATLQLWFGSGWVIPFPPSASLPGMCVNHIWVAPNREGSRGKTHSHGKRKMAEGRTKESHKDVAKSSREMEREREKVKKAFAKWKRIKLP